MKRACVVLSILFGCTAPTFAQGSVGVKAGVSGDPNQFYFGGQYESAPIADQLRFRPNLEVGIGDDLTLVAANIEFAYSLPLRNSLWRLFFGGGPALIFSSAHGNGHTGGGMNFLIGAAHRDGLFTEFKVGAVDSPEIKFAVGYSFR